MAENRQHGFESGRVDAGQEVDREKREKKLAFKGSRGLAEAAVNVLYHQRGFITKSAGHTEWMLTATGRTGAARTIAPDTLLQSVNKDDKMSTPQGWAKEQVNLLRALAQGEELKQMPARDGEDAKRVASLYAKFLEIAMRSGINPEQAMGHLSRMFKAYEGSGGKIYNERNQQNSGQMLEVPYMLIEYFEASAGDDEDEKDKGRGKASGVMFDLEDAFLTPEELADEKKKREEVWEEIRRLEEADANRMEGEE